MAIYLILMVKNNRSLAREAVIFASWNHAFHARKVDVTDISSSFWKFIRKVHASIIMENAAPSLSQIIIACPCEIS